MKRILSMALALASVIVLAPNAFAQTGPIGPSKGQMPTPAVARPIAGSIWAGSEDLDRFGKLSFEFRDQGIAIMVDAHATVQGTYVVDGANVTITFGNCVYRGTLQGNVLSGLAQTTGEGQRVSWTWTTNLQGPTGAASQK